MISRCVRRTVYPVITAEEWERQAPSPFHMDEICHHLKQLVLKHTKTVSMSLTLNMCDPLLKHECFIMSYLDVCHQGKHFRSYKRVNALPLIVYRMRLWLWWQAVTELDTCSGRLQCISHTPLTQQGLRLETATCPPNYSNSFWASPATDNGDASPAAYRGFTAMGGRE